MVEHTEGRGFDDGYSDLDELGQGGVEKSEGRHGGCREGDDIEGEDYRVGDTRYTTTRMRAEDENWGRD